MKLHTISLGKRNDAILALGNKRGVDSLSLGNTNTNTFFTNLSGSLIDKNYFLI